MCFINWIHYTHFFLDTTEVNFWVQFTPISVSDSFVYRIIIFYIKLFYTQYLLKK
jgi:hypothetical protein